MKLRAKTQEAPSKGRSLAARPLERQRNPPAQTILDHRASPAMLLLQLQRTRGNRYIQRLVAKLPLARCAERADEPAQRRLMLASLLSQSNATHAESNLQRQCGSCRQDEQRHDGSHIAHDLVERSVDPLTADTEAIDRQVASAVESHIMASKGGGAPLPDNVRVDMESAIGADFRAVRVHTDKDAISLNQAVGAKAFTHGSDIYFNSDRYNPHATLGRGLLAHELVHVVQQSGGELQGKSSTPPSRVRQLSAGSAIHRDPQVTGLAGPAEMPAGTGARVTLRTTAARGTAITYSFVGANNGAVLGGGTGLTTTLTAPAGSTGGNIAVQAADAANPADVSPVLNIALVEVQQPTFTFNPGMPAFAPANTMEASVCGNTATAAAVVAPAGRALTWSVVGDRHGATIDPATGDITPSATNTGNIVVRATDSALPAARNQQTLTIQAHPTGISNTRITQFPLAAPLTPYGAVYKHTFSSSGGNIASVVLTEQVLSGNDPFPGGGLPVLPGNLNARVAFMQDTIGTPAAGIDVNNFLPSPPRPGLPQEIDTPQTLYWRSDQCSAAPGVPPAATAADHWVPFVNVPIKARLFQKGANFFFVTSDNGVSTAPEPYIGTALAAPGAPAAPACAGGEKMASVTFSPSVIAADGNAATTTAGSVQATPAGSQVTWSFPSTTFGASIVAQGNPALFSAGTIAGRVRVRAALTATPGCFAEGWLRMQEVEIGPAIKFTPDSVRAGGATTRATVKTQPGGRIVLWSVQGPALGAVIARNADNSATITTGAQLGRITVRATDQRDGTRFTEASLVIR